MYILTLNSLSGLEMLIILICSVARRPQILNKSRVSLVFQQLFMGESAMLR
jgi:hypothetical protein